MSVQWTEKDDRDFEREFGNLLPPPKPQAHVRPEHRAWDRDYKRRNGHEKGCRLPAKPRFTSRILYAFGCLVVFVALAMFLLNTYVRVR